MQRSRLPPCSCCLALGSSSLEAVAQEMVAAALAPAEAAAVVAGQAFTFSMTFEVAPTIELLGVDGLSVEQEVWTASDEVVASELENLTVVQVVGSFHSTVDFSPEFCTSILANRLNARCMNFLAPAILTSKQLRDDLLKEEVLINQFNAIKSARVIVFGIGELEPESTVVSTGFLKESAIKNYLEKGAIGTILGRMIDQNGQQIYTEIDDRMIGVTLDEIKDIPCRLAVAGGPQKVEVVRATLKGKYPTHLVTDYETAKALL